MKKSKGFTLIEVMVALAVVAIGLSATLKAVNEEVGAVDLTRNKTLALWFFKKIKLVNIPDDMINIIFKHDELTQFCFYKPAFYLFYGCAAADANDLFPGYQALADLYFWEFLRILQQLCITFLPFFIYILLKKIFQVTAFKWFL